ncbi:MAG: O-antigen ligase family protein [Cyanobacteriota bacterium]|nr:O-antigen ligase family protein [Cyanobacteriota bacterium]
MSRSAGFVSWFWVGGWVPLALALLTVNVAPSLLVMLMGSLWGVSHRALWQPDPLLGWVGGLGVGLLGVTFLATDWSLSIPGLFNYLPFLLFFAASSQILRYPEWRLLSLQTLVAGSGWVAMLGWGQFFWHWQGEVTILGMPVLELAATDRPTSVFTSPNTLAVYLVVVLTLAVGLWLARPRQWLAPAALVLGLPLLVATASRNGWAIACLSLVGFLLFKRMWAAFIPLGGMIGIPLLAALNWWNLRQWVPALFWQRLADAFDPQARHFGSTISRLEAWNFALEMIRQRPWQGWGWQSFPAYYNAQIPPPTELLNHSHNLYLTVAAEGGLGIAVGLVGLWGVIVGRGWRQIQGDPVLLAVNLALLAYFASGLLDAVFFDGRINLLFWVVLAVAHGSSLARSDGDRSKGMPEAAPLPGEQPAQER